MLPVGPSNLSKVLEIANWDKLCLAKWQDFHLGLGRIHRIVGDVDIEGANLIGILKILSAQIAPNLPELAASSLERPKRSQAND